MLHLLKHKIPGQNKVIPGHTLKSLDFAGHPWTVGNYMHKSPKKIGLGEGGGGYSVKI